MKQRKWIGRDNKVFHYCSELDCAMRQFCGEKRWHGSARLFHDSRHVRKAVLAASCAIRARLRDIATADDRLLHAVLLNLERLDDRAKRLNAKGENLLEIVGFLLEVVARLLGYDWKVGKPNRQLAYSQTWDQVSTDDQKMKDPRQARDDGSHMDEQSRMTGLVATLFDEGYRVPQIARMLSMSQRRVKDKLVRSRRLRRGEHIYDRGTRDERPTK